VIGMLFTLRQSRRAFTVPVLGVAGAGSASSFALQGLFTQRISPGLVLAAGFSVVLFAVFVGEVRTLRIRRDNRLFVRSLLGGGGVNPKTCAFGISVSIGARGGSHFQVYVTDGIGYAEIVTFSSQKRAERAVRRLKECFFEVDDLAARSAAQQRVDADRRKWEANFELARAQVDAYYASGKFQRAGRWILAGIFLYVLAMLILAWLAGKRL
jgi:hypothetical protein